MWSKYKDSLIDDILAGAAGAAAGAPQAMGFAIIAGISPIYGLYTAIVSTIVGALTTGSAFMTVGPTNALALVLGSTIIRFDEADQIEVMFTLTLLVGVIQLSFGLLRLGSLTRFVSNAVMTGFIAGAGVLIILGQLSNLTGFAGERVSGALPRFWQWLTHLDQGNLQTTIIGVISIIVIYSLNQTRLRGIATLTALLGTAAFITAVGWGQVTQVRDMAQIPSGLPMPDMPNLSYAPELLTAAVATAILALVQSAGLAASLPEDEDHPLNVNRDFVGQGIANMIGGFFQNMPSGGSLSRTAVNMSAGARTRAANLFAGIFVGLILLIFQNVIEQIALAALAGQLIVAASSLIKPAQLSLVWNVNLSARIAMSATFVSTLLFPLEYSIYIGIALSLGMYVYSSATNIHVSQLVITHDHHFREEEIASTLPDHQIVIFSVTGNLYFAAVKKLEELLPSPSEADHTIIILRLRGNDYLGSTGIRFLERYAEQLAAHGSKLLLTGVNDKIRAELERTHALEELGEDNVFFADNTLFTATERALAYAQECLDQEIVNSSE